LIWLLRRIFNDLRHWDRPTQIAFGLAVVLLIIGVVLAVLAPQEQRMNVIIGVGGLLIVAEVAVLWGSRGMVTAYTQAQRLYLNGDLEQARELLESARATGKADMRVLTLLGSTYRQLGRLDESAAILYEALNKAPEHHFPLYNLGRTLLAQGKYAESANLIARALEAGAPAVVRFDLGEAFYWMGDSERAAEHLLKVQPTLSEPHRQLMAAWMLHRIKQSDPPDSRLIDTGILYWDAAADRFAETSYGQGVSEELRALKAVMSQRARNVHTSSTN